MDIKHEFNQWVQAKSGSPLKIKAPLLKASLDDCIRLLNNTKVNNVPITHTKKKEDLMRDVMSGWIGTTNDLLSPNPAKTINFRHVELPKTQEARNEIIREIEAIDKACSDQE